MAEPFVGEIRIFPFNSLPKGWAQCNGQILNINGNQALYSLIGNVYGGDGRTTFAVPNLIGRVPTQPANPSGVAIQSGEETHTLALNELPTHVHVLNATATAASTNVASNNVWAVTGAPAYAASASKPTALRVDSVASAGGGDAHQNMQPYAGVNYCIALVGYYPSRP